MTTMMVVVVVMTTMMVVVVVMMTTTMVVVVVMMMQVSRPLDNSATMCLATQILLFKVGVYASYLTENSL
jgi:hypothetical protein